MYYFVTSHHCLINFAFKMYQNIISGTGLKAPQDLSLLYDLIIICLCKHRTIVYSLNVYM